MKKDDVYYINLINAVGEKFSRIAYNCEKTATDLEKEIREICAKESGKDEILISDVMNIIRNAVLLRKKASMYRLISSVLINSKQRIIADKKFDKDIKKLLEKFIDGKIEFEKAVDDIIKILDNTIGISINKDEYYNVGQYEVRKHFNKLCIQ